MPFFGSTDLLLSGATWTSDVRLSGEADYISGIVFADQSGTIFIEQSADGTHWDISTSYAVTASDGKGFSEQLIGPYVRLRYLNGGTNQGAFRVSARYTSAGSR